MRANNCGIARRMADAIEDAAAFGARIATAFEQRIEARRRGRRGGRGGGDRNDAGVASGAFANWIRVRWRAYDEQQRRRTCAHAQLPPKSFDRPDHAKYSSIEAPYHSRLRIVANSVNEKPRAGVSFVTP
jgi:hypothetical protein